ncbi:unnamed protein product [Euphydryas editha]|uniref:Secreted protein n=1 Tax=Euphydryas editha TaxID=104508 RepID=A0AAU9TH15_EUPED|nr:unnamed protein product [Euphydryas editha]
MVRLGLAMVVGVAPALVSWWRGQGPLLPPPLSVESPCSEKSFKWPTRRSPSLSDCLESTSDEDSARSIVCHVRPKVIIDRSFTFAITKAYLTCVCIVVAGRCSKCHDIYVRDACAASAVLGYLVVLTRFDWIRIQYRFESPYTSK